METYLRSETVLERDHCRLQCDPLETPQASIVRQEDHDIHGYLVPPLNHQPMLVRSLACVCYLRTPDVRLQATGYTLQDQVWPCGAMYV